MSSNSAYLEGAITLLVEHFGIEKVRIAVEKVSSNGDSVDRPRERVVRMRTGKRKPSTSVSDSLQALRDEDPERHQVLIDFWNRLRDRELLPDPQDIRYFAQVVGLKHVEGTSRRQMIAPLIFFLLKQPLDRLQSDIQHAGEISEKHRKEGYSELTEKLLGKK